jgi:hypothetical protein
MNDGGSSILLNGSTDDGYWECSWIVGDERHTGAQTKMRDAIQDCLNKTFAALMLKWEQRRCACGAVGMHQCPGGVTQKSGSNG